MSTQIPPHPRPPIAATTSATNKTPVPKPRKRGAPPMKPAPYKQHREHRANDITTFKSNLPVQPQMRGASPVPAERKQQNRMSLKGEPSEEFYREKQQSPAPIEYGIPVIPLSPVDTRPRLNTPAVPPDPDIVLHSKSRNKGDPSHPPSSSGVSSVDTRPRLNTPAVPPDPDVLLRKKSSLPPVQLEKRLDPTVEEEVEVNLGYTVVESEGGGAADQTYAVVDHTVKRKTSIEKPKAPPLSCASKSKSPPPVLPSPYVPTTPTALSPLPPLGNEASTKNIHHAVSPTQASRPLASPSTNVPSSPSLSPSSSDYSVTSQHLKTHPSPSHVPSPLQAPPIPPDSGEYNVTSHRKVCLTTPPSSLSSQTPPIPVPPDSGEYHVTSHANKMLGLKPVKEPVDSRVPLPESGEEYSMIPSSPALVHNVQSIDAEEYSKLDVVGSIDDNYEVITADPVIKLKTVPTPSTTSDSKPKAPARRTAKQKIPGSLPARAGPQLPPPPQTSSSSSPAAKPKPTKPPPKPARPHFLPPPSSKVPSKVLKKSPSVPPTKPKPSSNPNVQPKPKVKPPPLSLRTGSYEEIDLPAAKEETTSITTSSEKTVSSASPNSNSAEHLVELDIDTLVQRREAAIKKKSVDNTVTPAGSNRYEYANDVLAHSHDVKRKSMDDVLAGSNRYQNQEIVNTHHERKSQSVGGVDDSPVDVDVEGNSTEKLKYENRDVISTHLVNEDVLKSDTSYAAPLSPSEVFTIPQHAVPGPLNYVEVDVDTPLAAAVGGDDEIPTSVRIYPNSRGYCDVNLDPNQVMTSIDAVLEDSGHLYTDVPTESEKAVDESHLYSDVVESNSNELTHGMEQQGTCKRDVNGHTESLAEEQKLGTGGEVGAGGKEDGANPLPDVTPSGNGIVTSQSVCDPVTGYCDIEVQDGPVILSKPPTTPPKPTKKAPVDPEAGHSRTPSGEEATGLSSSVEVISDEKRDSVDTAAVINGEDLTPPQTKPPPSPTTASPGSSKQLDKKRPPRRRMPPPPPPGTAAAAVKKPPVKSKDDSSGIMKKAAPSEGVVSSGVCTLPRTSKNTARSQRPPPPPVPFSRRKSDDHPVTLPPQPNLPSLTPPSPNLQSSEPASSPSLKKKLKGFLRTGRGSKRKSKGHAEEKEDLTQSLVLPPSSSSAPLKKSAGGPTLESYQGDDDLEGSGDFGIYSTIPDSLRASAKAPVVSIDEDGFGQQDEAGYDVIGAKVPSKKQKSKKTSKSSTIPRSASAEHLYETADFNSNNVAASRGACSTDNSPQVGRRSQDGGESKEQEVKVLDRPPEPEELPEGVSMDHLYAQVVKTKPGKKQKKNVPDSKKDESALSDNIPVEGVSGGADADGEGSDAKGDNKKFRNSTHEAQGLVVTCHDREGSAEREVNALPSGDIEHTAVTENGNVYALVSNVAKKKKRKKKFVEEKESEPAAVEEGESVANDKEVEVKADDSEVNADGDDGNKDKNSSENSPSSSSPSSPPVKPKHSPPQRKSSSVRQPPNKPPAFISRGDSSPASLRKVSVDLLPKESTSTSTTTTATTTTTTTTQVRSPVRRAPPPPSSKPPKSTSPPPTLPPPPPETPPPPPPPTETPPPPPQSTPISDDLLLNPVARSRMASLSSRPPDFPPPPPPPSAAAITGEEDPTYAVVEKVPPRKNKGKQKKEQKSASFDAPALADIASKPVSSRPPHTYKSVDEKITSNGRILVEGKTFVPVKSHGYTTVPTRRAQSMKQKEKMRKYPTLPQRHTPPPPPPPPPSDSPSPGVEERENKLGRGSVPRGSLTSEGTHQFLFRSDYASSLIKVGDRSNEDKSPVVNAEEDSDAEVCYSTEWETSSNGEDFEDGEMEGTDIPSSPRSKTFYIAQEILTTERTFVKGLTLLDKDFRQTVKSANNAHEKPVITEENLKLVLGNVGSILALNSGLLEELEKRMSMWDEHPLIGDILVGRAPYFKIYTEYISRFDNALKTLDEQKKNPLFCQLLQEFESQPKCANIPLAGYMLDIVQRITRYKLLIADYVKHLPEDSKDRQQSERALKIVAEVATHVNETIRQMDNFRKVVEVRKKLIGDSGETLITPSRKLLKEGELIKFSRKEKQPRMFFLFNDILIYASGIPPTNTTFKVIKRIPLEGMKVDLLEDPEMRHGLQIISTCKSFRLEASNEKERKSWYEVLEKAIKEQSERAVHRQQSRLSQVSEDYDDTDSVHPLGSFAPPWLPDSSVSMCQLCSFSFTMTRRRHHCRACGMIFCGDCSGYLAQLKYKNNKIGRVCQTCFEKLSESETNDRSPTKRKTLPKNKQVSMPSVLREVRARDQSAQISGYLHSSMSKTRRWKKRWFVVYDLVLYEFERHEDVSAKRSVTLPSYQVISPIPRHDDPLVFCLRHPGTGKEYFKADTEEQLDRWVEVLRKAVVGEMDDNTSLQTSSSASHTPSHHDSTSPPPSIHSRDSQNSLPTPLIPHDEEEGEEGDNGETREGNRSGDTDSYVGSTEGNNNIQPCD